MGKDLRSLLPLTAYKAPPVIVDDYEYFEKLSHGHYQFFRKKTGVDSTEQLLFDSDWLSSDEGIVTKMSVSSDHHNLAFIHLQPGQEQGVLYIYSITGLDSQKVYLFFLEFQKDWVFMLCVFKIFRRIERRKMIISFARNGS